MAYMICYMTATKSLSMKGLHNYCFLELLTATVLQTILI